MSDPTIPAETPIYGSAPQIAVDGTIVDLLVENLVELEVVEEAGGLSRCEALFSNTGEDAEGHVVQPFDAAGNPLAFGKALRVGLGEAGSPVELFVGRISALEGVWAEGQEPRLRVLAEDSLLAARLARRSKSHPSGTLKALVEAVAQGLGLTVSVDGCEQAIGIQVQLDESDLAFLRRVLARWDADCQVVGGELHVAPRARVRRSEVTLDYPGALIRVRALADLAHQVSTVTWSGWDVSQGTRITATSGAGSDRGPGTRGFTGTEVIEHAFGRRHEHLGGWSCATQAEAQALVDAAHAARARRFVNVHGECAGQVGLRVGTHLTLTGLGPRFSGPSYVTRVCHRYDRVDGYRCAFTAESARFGAGDE